MPDTNDRYTKKPFYMLMPLTYFMVRQIYRFDVKCRECGRGANVYLTTLLNKYGSDEQLSKVALKCTRCKSRDCYISPDIHFKPQNTIIPFPKRGP